jgi:lytic murein transglycosylase
LILGLAESKIRRLAMTVEDGNIKPMGRFCAFCVFALFCGPAATPALAAQCGGDFESFLSTFSREAAAQGVSARALAALDGITPNPQVIALDHRQGVFHQSFEQFSGHRIAERLVKAQKMMQTHAALLANIERQYGVPGSVLVAIWGLETGFGVDIGKTPVLRSLATLAYDCRRTQMFQGELLAALQIIDRGDLSPAEMRGAWAGELGQAQFLPSNYIKFAVDFDGNGRRDLIHSVPDTLASIANLLKSFGWQPGGGYREGSANFAVLTAWNKSTVYQKTIAAFAERLDER